MNTAKGIWAAAGTGIENEEAAAPTTDVVEALLSWRDARGDNAIDRKEIGAGGVVAIGENADLMVPAEVLGEERFEVVKFDGERAIAVAPAGGKLRMDGWAREERTLEVKTGHVVEVIVGSFVVRLTRERAGQKIAGAPFEGLKRGGVGVLLGSALAHAAVFAVMAYVQPALGATETDAYDRDNIELMQKLLNASAQPEAEQKPTDNSGSEGGNTAPAQPAQGKEGEAGRQDAPVRDARQAIKGTATPETTTMQRERELNAAANMGILGLLATQPKSDPNAPTVPWGTVSNGPDDLSRAGHLFGGSIDDAFGSGMGLNGWGEGGGGTADLFGVGDRFGTLGTGRCTAPDGNCSGIGHSGDKLGGGYKPKGPGPLRYGEPQANGHLPAEVIQRIVRQNGGRYRFCYQRALQSNPTLEGRVTVKFVIGRDGAVMLSADGGSDIPDSGVRQCVVSAFQSLSFPAPDSGLVTVVYPITFSPQ